MQQRLLELVQNLEATRAALLAAVEEVPDDRRDVAPRADAWSAGEILDHLSLIESGVARLVAGRVARAREEGVGPERDTSPGPRDLEGGGVTTRDPPLRAAGPIWPRPGTTTDVALGELTQSRAALLAAIADAGDLDLSRIRARHVMLGELDLYQWLLFVAQHEARHTEQLRELAGAPASGGGGAPPSTG